MWVMIRTRSLTISAMLIFMILVVLIMAMSAPGWVLVRVVLDVVPMPNRCRPLAPGQCRRSHLARIVRIANLHDKTGYNMVLGVQLGTKI